MLKTRVQGKDDDELRIDLPNELEQRLEAEAKRQDLSTDALARVLLEERLKSEGQNGGSAQPRVLAKNLPIKDRASEVAWLEKHRDEYAGQITPTIEGQACDNAIRPLAISLAKLHG